MDTDLTINVLDEEGEDNFEELIRLLAWMDFCSEHGLNVKFNVAYLGGFSARFKYNLLEKNDLYLQAKKNLEEYYAENLRGPQQFVI